jgi:hypothetical protein
MPEGSQLVKKAGDSLKRICSKTESPRMRATISWLVVLSGQIAQVRNDSRVTFCAPSMGCRYRRFASLFLDPGKALS